MSQIAGNLPSISKEIMINIFSRFLSGLLEKDSKFYSYLKEWESFKELLVQEPIDLDAIFLHIASLQLNLGKKT